jgi:hypothetical protein
MDVRWLEIQKMVSWIQRASRNYKKSLNEKNKKIKQ